MITVNNIFAINKGSLLATCDVHIAPWKMTLHEVKIFEKGANRWIALPSKEFINAMGEKKYTELVSFDSEGVKKRFQEQIMVAVDEFLVENPDMKPEDVIKAEEEFPF